VDYVATMRLVVLVLLASSLGACDAPDTRRQATRYVVALDERPDASEAWTPVGLQIREVPRAAQKALGVASGVMVTKVRGAASRSRILPGDVIVGVNQRPVSGVEEFNKVVAAQSHGTIGLLVRRAEADLYIPLEIQDAAVERDSAASRGAGTTTPEESFKAGRPTGKPLRT
jgi:C-terminal processing protease CtpA/Prc